MRRQDRCHLGPQAGNTLSKSVGLGPPRFKGVRDLDCLSRVVCAERPRT